MTIKGRFAALLAVTVFAALTSQTAFGFWSGAGSAGSGNGAAGAASLHEGVAPTVKATGSTTVTVSWDASSLSNGVPADGYIVKRYDGETGVQATIGVGCAGTITGVTCTESATPVGKWQYTVTPVFAINWRGAESAKSGAVNTGPEPVALGEADSFAVLGASTVTSAEVSALTGNLGVSPGTAMTGFPPGTVTGTMNSADAASNKAQADVGLAYADAAGRARAIPIAAGLGGLTLTRGVYKSASFAVDADLTLDAQNDPGAVFIFQAGSTLGTAASSHINLVNGAQACNVFWQVGSSATLGASSTFAGNILALTSISMGSGVAMNGRALAHNGAVTLIEDTVAAAHCAPTASPIPRDAPALSLLGSGSGSTVNDDVGPSGGSVEVAGLGGTGGRYSTSTTLNVAFTPGTDSGSGIATSGARLFRASATLSSDGVTNGSCGTFGAFTQVDANDPATPLSDTVPADRTCYRYEYLVTDTVGNQTAYVSPDVMVDASAPPAPALAFSAFDNTYWSDTGSTVFYRPGAARGGFQLSATSADPTAGISSYAFPTFPAGWTSTAAGTGIRTYAWSTANPVAPSGAQTVTATNNAGHQADSSFTLTPDSTFPSGGNVIYTNGYSVGSTVSVSFGKGSDTISGIDSASGTIEGATATFAANACGAFGSFAVLATNPLSGVSLPVTSGTCYEYRYSIADNVGNRTTYTSSSITKVDTVAPVDSVSLESASTPLRRPKAA